MSLVSALLLLLVVASFPNLTEACGGFFCEPSRPVVQSGESIAFGVDGNRVAMHVQVLYEGPAEAFSWLLPLPFQPTITVGSDLLFQSLFRQSLPTFALDIQNEVSATCSSDALEPVQCFARPMEDSDMSEGDMMEMDEDGAVVLDQGSVGPFDFTILQAAEKNPDSVLTWLEENGYDQPEGSAPLLNFYATTDHVFVAVKLTKTAETGDIQPLILTYDMPEDTTVEETAEGVAMARRAAMACVPIQLTSVAATDNMPIQVYIFGTARAVPLNFVELELDDTQVDWVSCLNNPGCYDDDYRSRFNAAATQLTNHSFVTEYAGPTTAVMTESIEIQFTAEEVAAVETWDDFQRFVPFLPDLPLVDTILQDYPLENFDATALSLELEEKLLKPARDAQAFVDSYPYLTRLYARLSPTSMTKDPFFAFKPELAEVSNIHRAIGVPICQDGNPSALSISVQDGADSIEIPATIGCNGWTPANTVVVSSSPLSPARQLTSWGFSGDQGLLVPRLEDGGFDMMLVNEAIAFGDSLVMNQTIPEYSATADEPPPTNAPDVTDTETNVPQSTDAPDGGSATDGPTSSPTASAAAGISMSAVLGASLLLCARLL